MLESVLAVIVAVAGVDHLRPRDPGQAVRASIERELPVQGVELLRRAGPRRPDPVVVRLGRIRDRLDVRPAARASSSTAETTCTTTRSCDEYNQVQDAEPGWEEIVDGYDVDALHLPAVRADHEGPGRVTPAGARRTATTTRSSTCASATRRAQSSKDRCVDRADDLAAIRSGGVRRDRSRCRSRRRRAAGRGRRARCRPGRRPRARA